VAAVDTMADAGGLVLLEALSIMLFAALLVHQTRRERCIKRMLRAWLHQVIRAIAGRQRSSSTEPARWVGLSVKMVGESPSVALAKVTDPDGVVLFASQGIPI